ncbi:hypothetical protein [Streptomyces kronopolitis]|uniref:hypothetical protein n=1 Tax=Streptomyces kronopolitis TaxID=1612435 RepID=UPI0036790977
MALRERIVLWSGEGRRRKDIAAVRRASDRIGRDRLEMIGGPSFDPVYRSDVIEIPRGHTICRRERVVGG